MCAVAWKTKQSMRHLAGKSTLTHKCSALSPFSLATPIEPLTVPPQKVAETDEGDATRDTYQRKVFYDGFNFFIAYWTGAPTKETRYTASEDGIAWETPIALSSWSVGPYYGGNIDIQYPNKGALTDEGEALDLAMVYAGSNGNVWYWESFVISSKTITRNAIWGLGSNQVQGGSITANLLGTRDVWICHSLTELRIGYFGTKRSSSKAVSHGGTTTGGAQILPYQTSDPYDLFILAKGGDNKLYYNTVGATGTPIRGSFTEVATLGTGFSDFSACSEAQNVGDSEIIDIVYIKSTGELAHKSFFDDELTSETILCESGASYPVIACGKGGRRYVRYVKDGVIKQQKLRNLNGVIQILTSEETLFSEHTYNNPAYLSTNQNVQHGQICLVWTEGTSTPYEVWFCTIGD